jgi:mono/diheme cytochrome c family protein
MEVLHHVRPRRPGDRVMMARTLGALVALRRLRSPLVIALALTAACSSGDRADGAADSALIVPGADSLAKRDSTIVTSTVTTETTVTTSTGIVTADSTAARDSAPILLVAADSAAGDSLYHNSRGRCITCHGTRGAGGGSLGPSLRDSVWLDTDGSAKGIAAMIRDGVAEPKGGSARMPSFARQLDPAQISRIAVYVYSLSHRGAMSADSAAARAAAGLATPADSALHQ